MKSPVEKKNNEGFTLVELLVSVVCCGIITFAVFTLSFTGVRVGKGAGKAASNLETVKTVLSLTEKLASSGKVKSVENLDAAGGGDAGGGGAGGGDAEGEEAAPGDWVLWGEKEGPGGGNAEPFPVLSYHAGRGVLAIGGAPVMENVDSAKAELSKDAKLLNFSVRTGGKTYKSSVYCRTSVGKDNPPQPSDTEQGSMGDTEYLARLNFLSLLCTQAGSSGKVQDPGEFASEASIGQYYSQWYKPGWNEGTPWCACFISWALEKRQADIEGEKAPRFANVEIGYDAWKCEECEDWDSVSIETELGKCKEWKEAIGSLLPVRNAEPGTVLVIPVPGDLIFFDFEKDGTPGHVGAVIFTDESKNAVYTIEGNSGGRVRLHIYSLTDPSILAYGQINWETQPAQP